MGKVSSVINPFLKNIPKNQKHQAFGSQNGIFSSIPITKKISSLQFQDDPI